MSPIATPEPAWATRARLWGMVHLLPSPGCPGHRSVAETVARAVEEARILVEAGFDGIVLENMHDFPTVPERAMGPEMAASLTAAAGAVRAEVPAGFPLGIQVLFAAHRTAVAVAAAADLQMVRVEAWTHAHVSDKGLVEASAGHTLRYARAIDAPAIEFWADVKKKHASHALTADLSLAEMAAALPLHGASAAILTGRTTGEPPEPDDFDRVREVCPLPLVLGSGLTVQNAPRWAGKVDAFIVGTSVKVDEDWRRRVDPRRAAALVAALGTR